MARTPPDSDLFATGLAGSLRWMWYWLTSRSGNASRAAAERWDEHVRPKLEERVSHAATPVKEALGRAGTLAERVDAPLPHATDR